MLSEHPGAGKMTVSCLSLMAVLSPSAYSQDGLLAFPPDVPPVAGLLALPGNLWNSYQYELLLLAMIIVLLVLVFVAYRARHSLQKKLEGELLVVAPGEKEERLDLQNLRKHRLRIGAGGDVAADCAVAAFELEGAYSPEKRNKVTLVRALAGSTRIFRAGRHRIVLNGSAEPIYDKDQIDLTDPFGAKAFIVFLCEDQPLPEGADESVGYVSQLPGKKQEEP